MQEDGRGGQDGLHDSTARAYSMGSPLLNLPGSMPPLPVDSVLAAASSSDGRSNTAQAGLPKSGRPSEAPTTTQSQASTSGLTSFFRTFTLSGSPASKAAAADALSSSSHADTVSSSSDSSMLPSTSNTAASSSNAPYRQGTSIHASRPSSSSSSFASLMSSSGPASGTAPATPPVIAGGTQIKRAFSNSSAAKRMRKLSNPIPSFLGSSSTGGGSRDSPTSTSSPLAGSPSGYSGETGSYRNLTPRQSLLKERDRDDQLRTPTQNRQSMFGTLPSSGSGIISSSIDFLTSITSLDKLPSVLGLSSFTAQDTYPRGEDGHHADLTEDRDLCIEDATGDEDIYSDSSLAVQRARANGLEDAATLSTDSHDSFEPDAVARVGTSTTLDSTGGSSSRHALSPYTSSLTYGSTSSLSTHDEAEHDSSAGVPLASQPIISNESRSSILDPVTYQTLRRKNSEADARRAERERQDRTRQLDLLDRLQEQAEHPHLRHVKTSNHLTSHTAALDSRPRSPLVPQREGKTTGIGLGSPPLRGAAVVNNVETPPAGEASEVKKSSRRRSLFGRLGFFPNNKATPTSASKKDTPPVPQVRLPQSNAVSSFGSTQAAPSYVGSFQAVAEATTNNDDYTAPTPSSSSRAIDVMGSPQSDASIGAFQASAQTNKGSGKRSRYIKTKAKNKSKREFNHLFLAQELDLGFSQDASSPAPSDTTHASSMPDLPETTVSVDSPTYSAAPSKGSNGRKASKATQIKSSKKASKEVPPSTWALNFSTDGSYLASAGQDGVIRIWQVISGSDERENVIKTMHTDVDDPATDADGSGIVIPAATSFVDHLSGQPMSKKDKRNSKISIASTSTTHGQVVGSTSNSGIPMASAAGSSSSLPFAPVFVNKPIHEWKGHTSDILDLSWSKNNFLISSSMDKTVRLWHISRKECLCAFQHPDFVTSIAFHPKDDRYFLSGSLDAKLRLWSIPDKKVHCWTQLPELVTSVAFTSEGKLACAGTFVGLCLFFDVRDLAFVAKLHSRSSRGKYAKGRKITSIVSLPKGEPSEPERILVTSNDSRLRLWDISGVCASPNDKTDNKPGAPRLISERHVEAKYKGHENTSSQIKASFSDDGRYVISGSEDRQCYIWQSGLLDFPVPFAQTSKKGADKSPGCESFNPSLGNDSHCPIGTSPGIVTCAVFAPMETRLTLARGGDPLYGSEDDPLHENKSDLQRSASQASSSSGSNPNEKPSTPFGSISNKSDDSAMALASGSSARGTIIITTDDNSGLIRVFRNNPIFSQPRPAAGKDVKSVTSSTKDKFFLNGDGAQRRASQISKVSRTTSRIRGSMERQRRGVDNKNELEELTA